jgi:Kdo2-lipid IVA lauroyltransferase/acyltransferase
MGGRGGGGAGTALAAGPAVRASDGAVSLLARSALAGLRALSWERSRAVGERLGDGVRFLGLRRRVALENLALAFPQWSVAERERVLREHYRELGRVVAEYARLDELARAPQGEVFVETSGLQVLEPLRGRGAILMSGHFSNFELMGAMLARLNPVDFLVKPLSNAGVERLIDGSRAAAGVGCISTSAGTRGVYQALAAGRWVAILADQDAGRRGLFVPFFGRPASTPAGPARLSLKTGAPIVMGFAMRRPDGRFDLPIQGPLEVAEPGAPDAVQRLTAHHVAVLEAQVRARPESWFWLHRRWKTRPPAGEPGGGAADAAPTGGESA